MLKKTVKKELKSPRFCWSCPPGTSPVSHEDSFFCGKSRTMADVQSDIYLIMASLWCGVGFERLAICSHEHFGFVILENLTWKMIFAELRFSSNVFFLLTFCRNPSGRFTRDMLYVALRLAGRLFIDSFTPTNHSCHPRNALYSFLPLGQPFSTVLLLRQQFINETSGDIV